MKHAYRKARQLVVVGLVLVSIGTWLGCSEDSGDGSGTSAVEILLVNESGASDITVVVALGDDVNSEYFLGSLLLEPEPIAQDSDGFSYHGILRVGSSQVGRVTAGDKLRVIATQGASAGQQKVCTLDEAVDEGDIWVIVNGTVVRCYFHTVECDDETC